MFNLFTSVILGDISIGIFYIISGLFILLHNSKNIIHRLYFVFTFFCGITAIMTGTVSFLQSKYIYLQFLDNIKFITFLIGLLAAVIFVMHFPEKTKLSFKRFILLLSLPIIYFVYLSLTNNYFSIHYENNILVKTRSIYYLFYILFFSFLILFGIYVLIRKLLTLPSIIQKNQVRLFMIGGILCFFFIVFLGLLPTYMFNISMINGLHIGAFLLNIFIWLAIIKYQAFDIKTAIHYSFFWLLATIVIFLPIITTPIIAQELHLPPMNIYIYIIWGIVSIFYYLGIHKYVLPKINQLALRKKIKLNLAAQQFIENINSITNLKDLEINLYECIRNNIYASDSLLLSLNDKDYYFGKFAQSKTEIELYKNNLTWLQDFDDILTEKLLKDIEIPHHFFKEHSFHLISKLVYDNRLLGIICLKNKKTFKPYYFDEIKFLEAISHDIASLLNKNLLIQRASDVASDIIHKIKNTSESLEYTISKLTQKDTLTHRDKVQLKEAFKEMERLHQFSKKHLTIEMLDRIEFIEKYPINLWEIMTDSIRTNQGKIQEKQIKVMNHIPQNMIVFADKLFLQIVFVNLIENSIKFSDSHKQIDLNITETKHHQMITVKDQGKGISSYKQKEIFEGGTGKYTSYELGLSLCQKIILKYNGDLQIVSHEKEGTIVTIKLPKEDLK